jgi:hypothetical protein
VTAELGIACCELAASRLLNENTNLFGNAHLQIDLASQEVGSPRMPSVAPEINGRWMALA